MGFVLKDYLYWRGDVDIEVSPINDVDELLFACVGKLDYTGVFPDGETELSLQEAFRRCLQLNPNRDKLGVFCGETLWSILETMSAAGRYRQITVSGYERKVLASETEQFSAMTIHAPTDVHYVTFRGTDDSLIGWKEDCHLAVLESVPAQRDALAYLHRQAAGFPGKLVVSGHSKGGNLAVYAAALANTAVQQRIERIISYDGPGFPETFGQSAGFQRIQNRIVTFVPFHSIVGMIMNLPGTMQVVSSEEKGIGAHDVFTWNVGPLGLDRCHELSLTSRVFREALADTLAEMDRGERQELVDDIFELLSSTGADQLMDFTEHPLEDVLELATNYHKATELRSFLRTLSAFSIRERLEQLQEERKARRERAKDRDD